MGCGQTKADQQPMETPAPPPAPGRAPPPEDLDNEDGARDERSMHVNDYITRMKKYKAKFRAADKDHNGTLSPKEVEELLKAGGEHFTAKRIDRWIKKADKDHDGQISWEEFVNAMDKNTYSRANKGSKTGGVSPSLEQVMEFFQKECGENREYVRRKELVHFYQKQLKMSSDDAMSQAQKTIAKLKKMHPEGDENEVCASSLFSELSKDEPPQAKQVRMARYKAAMATLEQRFHKLDKDQDGHVSLAEFLKDSKNSAATETAFRNLDVDGDGEVTWAEFVAELHKQYNIRLAV